MDMIEVYINNECFELVQRNAAIPFENNGTKLPDGNWKIPVSQEIVDRLSKHQMKDETLSDSIFRILSTQLGKH